MASETKVSISARRVNELDLSQNSNTVSMLVPPSSLFTQ